MPLKALSFLGLEDARQGVFGYRHSVSAQLVSQGQEVG